MLTRYARMDATMFASRLKEWKGLQPVLTGDNQVAAQLLTRFTSTGEALLNELPGKPERSPDQQSSAGAIHDACRTVRRKFMLMHASWLYSVLTNHRTIYRQLGDLAAGAADIVPGLVPTGEQLRSERQRPQFAKEGREIDQGIFFWGLLRNAECGSHILEALRLPTDKAQAHLSMFRREGCIQLSTMRIERRGCAAYLTVQNDACLNAEDDQLIADMETAVDLALLHDEISVGVLRGGVMTHQKYLGRRVFSAGINLKCLARGQISFVNFLLQRELGYISKIQRGLFIPGLESTWGRGRNEKPWIAAVDTFAIGGGAQLLFVFDRVIATPEAYISLPAAQEGIVPGVANLRLPRLVGGRVARQVILWGRKIAAHEPNASMLIDQVVPEQSMEAAIQEGIMQLNNAGVRANRRMLILAEEPIEQFRTYMAEFALEQSQRLYSDDVIAKVARAYNN
jgi:(3,5-dihydroxyphenyl)acetyl-CoA 1,2-dioxygenase